jgi:hypothetical protein
MLKRRGAVSDNIALRLAWSPLAESQNLQSNRIARHDARLQNVRVHEDKHLTAR